MIKIIAISFSLLIGISAFGNGDKDKKSKHDDKGISFFHGTFEEAKLLAKEKNKLIFVDAYASWCGPCKMMARNTFTDKTVGEYFNENFINLKIDMEKGEGPTLSREWRVRAYPTLIFLNSDGQVVKQDLGYKNPEQFLEVGKSAAAVK